MYFNSSHYVTQYKILFLVIVAIRIGQLNSLFKALCYFKYYTNNNKHGVTYRKRFLNIL